MLRIGLMQRSPLFQLSRYLAPHRMTMVCASLCSILNQVFDLLPEILMGIAIDVVVNKQDSFLSRIGFPEITTQLIILGALCLITWTFESIFQYLYIVLWRHLAQTIQHSLRMAGYVHLQNLEMAYFEEKNTGELLSILNDDVNQLERFFDNGINAIIQIATSTLMTAAVFFYTSPAVAFYTLAPTPFICMIAWVFQARLAIFHSAARRQAAILASRLTNNILGITTIKSYATEQSEANRIATASKNYMRANSQMTYAFAAFRPTIRMAVVLGFVATVVVGGWYAHQGIIPVGAYSSLVFLTQRLLWPFTELAEIVNDYKRAMCASGRVLDLIRTPIGIIDGSVAVSPQEIKGTIRFEHVSFTYPNNTTVFEDFSCVIHAGQTTAFVGATGSGKSSLIKLLLRFYEPTKGTIFIDNYDITRMTLASIRRSISFVSQDPFLFHGTLYENIAYGSPRQTPDAAIIRAAQVAHADEFIQKLPSGYECIVGERGQKISGGQRQRIAIARAVLKNAPIFIFDEATSAVDNETEAAIQKSLVEIGHNHTTIIIAHRLSTIRHADTIHVLDQGKIVESGNHYTLLALNKTYAGLWKLQTGTLE
jgi:ATP-binding cassette, subfamily B, bacterial